MATLRVISLALLATGLVASSAYAQSSSKPLDTRIPPMTGFPQASVASAAPGGTTSAGAASTTGAASASTTPGGATPTNPGAAPDINYGDTGGPRIGGVAADDDATDSCDNKPQVHGSVETGVVASNRFSGNYESGTVNITKPVGDCTKPNSGGVSVSVSAGEGHFYTRGNH
jgi:hypothetical protein